MKYYGFVSKQAKNFVHSSNDSLKRNVSKKFREFWEIGSLTGFAADGKLHFMVHLPILQCVMSTMVHIEIKKRGNEHENKKGI